MQNSIPISCGASELYKYIQMQAFANWPPQWQIQLPAWGQFKSSLDWKHLYDIPLSPQVHLDKMFSR